jgi:cell division protein FtsW
MFLKKWFWQQDKVILFTMLFSLFIGFMTITKLSFVLSNRFSSHFLFFILKQGIFIFIGLICFFIFSIINWNKMKRILWIGFVLFLIITFITVVIGTKVNGVRRWLHFGSFTLQSSEFLKVFSIYPIAYLLSKSKHSLVIILLFITVGSLLIQPDLGMSFLVSSTAASQIFLKGQNLMLYFKIFGVVLIFGILSALFLAEYAKNRILIFFGQKKGFQIEQAIKLISSSSIYGQNDSNIYIPDSHCDFIFTEICGFFGIFIAIVIIFLPILINLRIFQKTKEDYDSDDKQLLMLGIGFHYAIQMYFHILSNLGVVPTKGVTLPFFSFGGSSIIAQCCLFGILSSILKRKLL